MPTKCALRTGLLILALCISGNALAQDSPDADRFFPRQGFLLTGYGGAGYHALFGEDATPNNFSAIFAPIMLFQVSDRFLFEGELEFEIEEGVTATELEYAQVDVALNNNLTLVAGKFLLPFNTFSERLHPTWINRLVSGPALYGGHGSLGPADPLLPVLSDIGIQLRGAFSVDGFSTFTAEAFISQGPMPATDEHDEEVAAPEGETPAERIASAVACRSSGDEGGDLAFGVDFVDNNENKLVGGRVGFGVAPYFEANVSAMSGAYDEHGDLRFSALGVHLEGRHKHLTVHSEFIQTWQDLGEEEHVDEPAAGAGKAATATLRQEATETLSRSGYWIQLAYRSGKWQPVVRWTQLFESDIDGEVVTEAGTQLALGLDYWIEPGLAAKLEYLINNEDVDIDNNRIAVQLAFGF